MKNKRVPLLVYGNSMANASYQDATLNGSVDRLESLGPDKPPYQFSETTSTGRVQEVGQLCTSLQHSRTELYPYDKTLLSYYENTSPRNPASRGLHLIIHHIHTFRVPGNLQYLRIRYHGNYCHSPSSWQEFSALSLEQSSYDTCSVANKAFGNRTRGVRRGLFEWGRLKIGIEEDRSLMS